MRLRVRVQGSALFVVLRAMLARTMSRFDHARSAQLMPDVTASTSSRIHGTLDRVGMSGIEVPVLVADADGVVTRVPGKADAYVSLDDADAKGIHMSRLFLALEDELASQGISPKMIGRTLGRFLASHQQLSRSASLAVSFEHMLRRPALKSDNRGWRSYPVTLSGVQDENGLRCHVGVRISYSSTCPCSAALARQLIQENFSERFGASGAIDAAEVRAWLRSEDAINATPHSQRSHADVLLTLADPARPIELAELIDIVEKTLGTPVQAAVKRADEQEFARLNAANLMFCEDAARRVRAVLDGDGRIADFRVRVAHLESLHPHDAVAIVTKGVPGGLRPE